MKKHLYKIEVAWRKRQKRRTRYTVVLKPVIPEGMFYILDRVKTLCYTKLKLKAWVVFIWKGWRLPADHSIQIIT
ncbi:hypothetical protein LCGC14_2051010, partial [marine sediment metagenome]